MRLRRLSPLHILGRLFMASLLLVGLSISSHSLLGHVHALPVQTTSMDAAADLAMTHHHSSDIASLEAAGVIHACCEPEAAVQTCLAACASVACATPILPGGQTALLVTAHSGLQPIAALSPGSREPDVDTPPPKFRL